MNHKFVIIEGIYSGWEIIGYTDSEDDAMQICAQHNAASDGNSDLLWYYKEIRRANSPTKRERLNYVYEFKYTRKRGGGWGLFIHELEYYVEGSVQNAPKIEVEEAPFGVIVRVPLVDADYDRAERIAQDTLYQYLYNKQMREEGEFDV